MPVQAHRTGHTGKPDIARRRGPNDTLTWSGSNPGPAIIRGVTGESPTPQYRPECNRSESRRLFNMTRQYINSKAKDNIDPTQITLVRSRSRYVLQDVITISVLWLKTFPCILNEFINSRAREKLPTRSLARSLKA